MYFVEMEGQEKGIRNEIRKKKLFTVKLIWYYNV